ncbi:hypothetical protein SERLA73DRAFT_177248 [Serpula lacrymans var. lacrymans S7.3]|uniref:BZIP domain-containing protein n=2 Tax=Serpula lacrymans var. lacrymans TaxID=341189 RepID=F8PNN7_SERL3|nr:uncharacterized protein SERLADRAFT_460749 [Serpula lacrymans var. lacrymans S7.9]EGO01764.1 hypothetical protein SERLA73DRAFT_177248 [Serpula lacrymans var. lacrymans S7.3]EGO27402.1 hypothetical protein SERLADRAFT_460749 [Serpula lacrymans var. lacrymans S7.9]
MPESHSRARSLSGDLDDSDLESHADDAQGPSKPGRKKNPNSQAARRDQNRIAQREFRLRKQQRIRDLEARVELLSGSQDEALNDMRAICKDLMAENQTLRNLLKSVSGFISEGFGGLLPKLGWDLSEFNTFLNKSETDTAWESFQRRKHSHSTTQSTGAMSTVLGPPSTKRPAPEDDHITGGKKPRRMGGSEDKDDPHQSAHDKYSLLVPLNPTVPSNNLYSSNARSPHDSSLTHSSNSNSTSTSNTIFSDLMRNTAGSPMFIQPSPPSSTPSQYGNTSSGPPPSSANVNGAYHPQGPYMPPLNMNLEQSLPSLSFPQSGGATNGGNSQRMTPQNPLSNDPHDTDDSSNRGEALKLITYHLDNFKRNSAYCLPSSLRPTLVQRTVPHESVIDRILHPELRDRMILLRGQFVLIDCLFDYKRNVTIHGDDVLAHSNWEIGESWLRKYGYLVDNATLSICNRWRRERGETELRPADLSSDQQPHQLHSHQQQQSQQQGREA